VEVHSVENLHAKVFVAGARALVGSTNVSFTSATGLVEALLETSDREPVRQCRDCVKSLLRLMPGGCSGSIDRRGLEKEASSNLQSPHD
jgi:hypothetical protein